jgi:hypothetical protein
MEFHSPYSGMVSCSGAVHSGESVTPDSFLCLVRLLTLFSFFCRPYSEIANQAFINDIMDGYFPSEFKTSCPDGVILEIRDRSSEEYGSESYQAFVGKGRTVGDGNKVRNACDFSPLRPIIRGCAVVSSQEPWQTWATQKCH